MADSGVSDKQCLEDVIKEVLESLSLIQSGQRDDSVLRDKIKTHETKKEIFAYLAQINQLIMQIEAFIERIGVLGNVRNMIATDQVQPKRILKNLKEVREQLDLLLDLLGEEDEFVNKCITCLCEMLTQGVKIPQLKHFNLSSINTISAANVFTKAMPSKKVKELMSYLQDSSATKCLIVALSSCFLLSYNMKLAITAGIGVGGVFLKSLCDETLRCLQNNEAFYKELGEFETDFFNCGISAKLTTVLSNFEKELANERRTANSIVVVRNSYNQVLTSIRDSKSSEINKEKNEEQILEEMSENPAFNVLIYPVVEALKCEKELAWMIMKDILKKE